MLLSQNRYGEAAAVLAGARLADPGLAAYARYFAAVAQLRGGRPAEARRTLSELYTASPPGALAEAVPLALAESLEATGDPAAAAPLYDSVLAAKPGNAAAVLERSIKAALAAGDRKRVEAGALRLYSEFPLSESSDLASIQIDALRAGASPELAAALSRADLLRAEALFAARRHADAQPLFERLATDPFADDRTLVALRIAECHYHRARYTAALAALTPLAEAGPRAVEARYFLASTLRRLKRTDEFVASVRRLADEYPGTYWAQEALNDLATYYVVSDDQEAAADVFRLMLERFPTGRHTERAAWKLGWWHYRAREFGAAAGVFERAATAAPRSDYRPAWLYWAARARERSADLAGADSMDRLVATDYLHLYYGRLAEAALTSRGHTVTPAPAPRSTTSRSAPPPTRELVEALITIERYELARAELEYARRRWGPSPQLDATLAFTLNRMGDYRGGSVLMKRTYPQYMAAGGELLPVDVRRVIFPLAYWELIAEYSKARGLDPYLVSALIGQESAFDADIKSRANAYGLMQILPSTGRRLARSEGMKRFRTSMLVDPRTNVRLGTRYFAGLLARFGDVHLALAGYNAGESRVVRWTSEKPSLPDDEFIDDIPFPETQTYVRKIVGTMHDYRQLYGDGQAASLPLARESAVAQLDVDLVPTLAAPPPAAPQGRATTGTTRTKAPAKKPAKKPVKKPSASASRSQQRAG